MIRRNAKAARVLERRRACADRTLTALEAIYGNGDARDNLTDALTDLLHSGLSLETLRGCVESAQMHAQDESEPPR